MDYRKRSFSDIFKSSDKDLWDFQRKIYKERPVGSEFDYYPNPMNRKWKVRVEVKRHYFGICNPVTPTGRPSLYLKTEVVLLEDMVAENGITMKGETVEVTNQVYCDI